MKSICTIIDANNDKVTLFYDEEQSKIVTSDGESLAVYPSEVDDYDEAVKIVDTLYFQDGAGVWGAEWTEVDEDD